MKLKCGCFISSCFRFPAGGFARSSLSLGSAGTRRTVYYTEEETNEDDQPKVVILSFPYLF